MSKEKSLKFLGIGIILVVIQSFFQEHEAFIAIYSKYVGYLTPLIYAFFITIFLDPVVSLIEEKFNMKRILAVISTIILVGFIIFIGIAIIVPQVGKSLRELYDKLPVMQEQIEKYATLGIDFLKEKNILTIGDAEIRESINSFIRDNMTSIQDFGLSAFWNIVWWGVALTKFFIGFFLAFLILIDKEYFIGFLRNIFSIIFGAEKSSATIDFLEKSRKILMSYIWGRIIVSTAVGFITFAVMFVTKTPYAVISGIMIGLGNMIPYIGSIVAGIIAVFLVALANPYKLIFLALAITIAQLVDGWIIGPKIVSETVGMRTFWIVLSVLIGGSLFGPVGMFFGVPIFGMLKLIYLKLLRKEEKQIDE
ncbi:AI-2E family transporter [Fusobacterium sp. SYSU M8D902]|uniref:AI-2E family transporter n=1 Tax=Fusobacterium sp. SYSU M8D902 TaxID=3159562 RepID=UPI0032E4032E